MFAYETWYKVHQSQIRYRRVQRQLLDGAGVIYYFRIFSWRCCNRIIHRLDFGSCSIRRAGSMDEIRVNSTRRSNFVRYNGLVLRFWPSKAMRRRKEVDRQIFLCLRSGCITATCVLKIIIGLKSFRYYLQICIKKSVTIINLLDGLEWGN